VIKPSDLVFKAADKLNDLENWAVKLKVWKYPRAVERADILDAQKRALIMEYKNLRTLYYKKTGERPPESPFLKMEAWKDSCEAWNQMVAEAIDTFLGEDKRER
jgi:hypothetical protein